MYDDEMMNETVEDIVCELGDKADGYNVGNDGLVIAISQKEILDCCDRIKAAWKREKEAYVRLQNAVECFLDGEICEERTTEMCKALGAVLAKFEEGRRIVIGRPDQKVADRRISHLEAQTADLRRLKIAEDALEFVAGCITRDCLNDCRHTEECLGHDGCLCTNRIDGALAEIRDAMPRRNCERFDSYNDAVLEWK